jgi:hypothetical protein
MKYLFAAALATSLAALCVPAAQAQDANIIVNGQALSKWKVAESDHFMIYGEGDEKQLAKLSGRLEAVHYLLKIATRMKEPADGRIVKVKVFVVDDIADVRRLIGDPQSPAAGYYDAQLAGAISVIPRNSGTSGSFSGELILFHEYAHHFMLQYQPGVYPAWYVEGFAEIIGTSSFEKPGAITFGKAAKHREAEMRGSARYPAAKMVDGRYIEDSRKGNGWNYGNAWALAHYLTFSDERKGQLGAYLNAINAGQSLAEAAKAFGDLNRLSRDLNVYLDGGSVPYKTPALPPEVMKDPDIRTLTVAEAEYIEPQIVMERITSIMSREKYADWSKFQEAQKRPVKKDYDAYFAEENAEREKWLKLLGTSAARLPNDLISWTIKAQAQCMAEDFAGCQTSADRALALQAGNMQAMLRKGEALLGLSKTAPEAERKALAKDARKWLLEANAASPNAHEPLLLYYESFAAEGRKAPQEAIDALSQVVDTIPQISRPRLLLGRELIARGQYALAKKRLTPLAFAPHESVDQAAAKAMIDAIPAEGAGEAS